MPNRLRLIFCFFLFSFVCVSYGQVSMRNRAKTPEKVDTKLPFKSRWAFRTNAIDWVLLLPNLTAEFDLFNSPFKHYTLSLGVKGNWKTNQNYVPDIVYNLLDVRSEFRWYHRTSPRSYRRPDTLKISIFKRLQEDVFTWKRFHPRYWRAYYIGAYADVCDYSLKFGSEGRQGRAFGLGVSGGFGIPLYAYKKNCLDLEFGASVGMVYTEYDVFKRDVESNSYPVIPNKHKDFHLLPYPVISELRVAFVYRFASIKDKYTRIDEAKREARLERKRLRALAKDSINEMRAKVRQERELRKDSLMKVKELEKLRKAALKDSLEQVKLNEKQARIAMEDSIRAAAKLRKALDKKNERTEEAEDSLVEKKLQEAVGSILQDSLPTKVEIIPIEQMPAKEKVEKDTLQTVSDSAKQAAAFLMERIKLTKPLENNHSVFISTEKLSRHLPVQLSSVLQTVMIIGGFAKIKKRKELVDEGEI